MEKRRNCSLGAISPLFYNIFHLLLGFHVGTRFSLRDKRLFEISEVEITRVNCISIQAIVDQRIEIRSNAFLFLGHNIKCVCMCECSLLCALCGRVRARVYTYIILLHGLVGPAFLLCIRGTFCIYLVLCFCIISITDFYALSALNPCSVFNFLLNAAWTP